MCDGTSAERRRAPPKSPLTPAFLLRVPLRREPPHPLSPNRSRWFFSISSA